MSRAKEEAPDALQGIEGEPTETRSKETTTMTTLLDTSPTATIDCDILECSGIAANHDDRDSAADWLHGVAPLPSHALGVWPSKYGLNDWAAWVQIDEGSRSAVELRELAAALTAEADRVDALNAAADPRPAVTA